MTKAPATTRRTLAQVVVCRGCCCGETRKGHAEVPVDWLKDEWRRRGLAKHVHLTVSGCLGPCDVANVVLVAEGAGLTWLGALAGREAYEELLAWASRVAEAGALAPLPRALERHVFERYRTGRGAAVA